MGEILQKTTLNFKNKLLKTPIIKDDFYGFLQVKEATGWVNEKDGQRIWRCLCTACNTVVYLKTDQLVNYKSCGCKKGSKTLYCHLHHIEGTTLEALTRKNRIDNKSGYPGVYKRKDGGKWRASIGFKGKRILLGSYETFDEAKTARLEAEEKFWKPFLDEHKA